MQHTVNSLVPAIPSPGATAPSLVPFSRSTLFTGNYLTWIPGPEFYLEHPNAGGAVVLSTDLADGVWQALAILHGQCKVNEHVRAIAADIGMPAPPTWLTLPFYRHFNLLCSPFTSKEAAEQTIARAQQCGMEAVAWASTFVAKTSTDPVLGRAVRAGLAPALLEYYKCIAWYDWPAEGNPDRSIILHPTAAQGDYEQYRPSSPFFGIPVPGRRVPRTVDPRVRVLPTIEEEEEPESEAEEVGLMD